MLSGLVSFCCACKAHTWSLVSLIMNNDKDTAYLFVPGLARVAEGSLLTRVATQAM